MKEKNKKLELLSPAGNLHKMKVALAHGADAVYAGIPDFSLRVRINDFDLEKIAEAATYCWERGKKIYITVNIFAHSRHIKALSSYIKKLKLIGVDALIISDPGVLSLVKSIWPEAEIHLSTQANCVNWRSADFWRKQGVSRIILGRETSLSEISEISQKVSELELEYFVHGAMCMAYSGRCFLSKEFSGRSANLGDCIQPCRWEYQETEKKSIIKAKGHDEEFEIVEENHGSYILNSKDLCLIKHLKELRDAGVSSFKIEGRAKSAYYQALIAGIYSRVLKNIDTVENEENDFLFKELQDKITNRGYTTGFLFGDEDMKKTWGQTQSESHKKITWEFCGEIISSLKNGTNKTIVHNTLCLDDYVEAILPGYEIRRVEIKKIISSQRKNLKEAHGGADNLFEIHFDCILPKMTVLRRKITVQ